MAFGSSVVSRAVAPTGLIDGLGLGVCRHNFRLDQRGKLGDAVQNDRLVVVLLRGKGLDCIQHVLISLRHREQTDILIPDKASRSVFRPDEDRFREHRGQRGLAHAALPEQGADDGPVRLGPGQG